MHIEFIAVQKGSVADRYGNRIFNATSPKDAVWQGVLDGFERGWEAALEAVEALYPDLYQAKIEQELEKELGMSKDQSRETFCQLEDITKVTIDSTW